MFQHCLTRKCFCWMHAVTAFLAMLSGLLDCWRLSGLLEAFWTASGLLEAFWRTSGLLEAFWRALESSELCIVLFSELWWASSLTVFHLAVQKWCIPALFTYIPSLSQHVFCARLYCIPALLACISTTFEHSLHASQYIELSILGCQKGA